jgi:hypothetical protein
VAWKGSGTDPSIWVSHSNALQPNASTGQYTFTPQQKVLTLGTTTSPAICSSNGTLYLFYKGESDDYIYWATSSDSGNTWVDNHKLALGNGIQLPEPGSDDQNPQTSAGPTAVSANNCIYLFWKDATKNDILWTVTSPIGENSDLWAYETSITTPNGAPETTVSPAVTLQGETIHLVIKGQSDGNLYWTTYSTQVNPGGNNLYFDTGGPWSSQTQIFSNVAATAPALVCDGNGVVWLAWTGGNGGVTYAYLNSGKWVGETNRAGIGSSDRPALISTGKDSAMIMMAWKGQQGDPGIYYSSMIAP